MIGLDGRSSTADGYFSRPRTGTSLWPAKVDTLGMRPRACTRPAMPRPFLAGDDPGSRSRPVHLPRNSMSLRVYGLSCAFRPSLRRGRVHACGPNERIERSPVIGRVVISSSETTPASRFWTLASRPSGFCAAGTKTRSDGSPLISHHRAETMTGCLRGAPACVRSNTWTTLHPLKTLNRMRDRCRRATDSITICGRSALRRLCQSGPPSFSRAFRTAGSRPLHVGSVATGEQMSVWSTVEGCPS